MNPSFFHPPTLTGSANRAFKLVHRGFTLIEIIVVVAIIGILASLALLVGSRVKEYSRIDLTKSLLTVLDNTQESYHHDRDAAPPFKYTDTSQQRNEFAIVDARIAPVTLASADPSVRAEPSTTFYILATGEAPSVQAAIGGIDSRFVVRAPIDLDSAPHSPDPNDFSVITTKSTFRPQTSTTGEVVYGLVIKDAWGNAIRYVHPKFQGGYGDFSATGGAPSSPAGRDAVFNTSGSFTLKQGGTSVALKFRRSFRPFDPKVNPSYVGDADEGLCTGGRGYFYSPGADKDPGTRADNVYVNRPQFPAETAKFE